MPAFQEKLPFIWIMVENVVGVTQVKSNSSAASE
jgi:hypothetical protein